jgi:hypothetical protein
MKSKGWFAVSLETLEHVMADLDDRGKGRLIQNVCKDSRLLTREELAKKYPFVMVGVNG